MPSTSSPRIDVEFSLALHNRTGKYFIGRDLIADNSDQLGRVWYWRYPAASSPQGLMARVIGRALAVETGFRVNNPDLARLAPRIRTGRPVLHLDPSTVVIHQLRATDAVLCHDLGPLTHPELFSPSVAALYQAAYAQIAACEPHMVFVSQASQRAFHRLFDVRCGSSRVIYPAVRTEVSNGPREALAGVLKPFLLTVGNVGSRKNQRRAIEAFARSGLAREGVQYVVCGGREPGYEAVVAAADGEPGVRLLSYLDDAVLNWLYDNAAGFVLPSLLEGFGIPVAEALAHDLVPIVSRDSVLHEVAGDSAVLVDPLDVGELAQAMRTVIGLSEPERRARLRRGSAALARFTRTEFSNGWRQLIHSLASPADVTRRTAPHPQFSH